MVSGLEISKIITFCCCKICQIWSLAFTLTAVKVTFWCSLRLSLSQNGCQRSALITGGLFSWVFFDCSSIFDFLKKIEKLCEQRAKSILEKMEDLDFFEFWWLWMVHFGNFGYFDGWESPKIAENRRNRPKSPSFKFENSLKICCLVVEWWKVEVKNNTESFYTGVLLSFGMCLLWHFLSGFGSLFEKCW